MCVWQTPSLGLSLAFLNGARLFPTQGGGNEGHRDRGLSRREGPSHHALASVLFPLL